MKYCTYRYRYTKMRKSDRVKHIQYCRLKDINILQVHPKPSLPFWLEDINSLPYWLEDALIN